ncbi:MAG: GNAT family N-acetyltransferase [Clostridia bacterium]|nr:GNAT family N-acetyltransferase [Clostridia bacterium]
MKYNIRKMQPSEYFLLNDFLYNAIFIPQGITPPPKNIIENKDLQVYVKDFGKQKDDIALLAEVDGKIVGAVWTRIMDDYGHIDNDTPSLAISLYKEYRGYGIGTDLMRNMLLQLKQGGYKRVSLSVQKANYAVKMYKKVGFQIIEENLEEYLMVCKL